MNPPLKWITPSATRFILRLTPHYSARQVASNEREEVWIIFAGDDLSNMHLQVHLRPLANSFWKVANIIGPGEHELRDLADCLGVVRSNIRWNPRAR